MEVKKEVMISLKVLVDKTQNRVVFAEADKDFVNILLSFLTLPMGTIVRLLQKQSESSVIGCMNTLYSGLEKLEARYLQSAQHKDFLLRPENSSDHLYRKLKLNIDDTERPIYVSTVLQTRKNYLEYENREKYFIDEKLNYNEGGVFVKEKAMFLVTEDLKVMPFSSTGTFELLMKHGVQDINNLDEKVVKIGSAEILSLLKFSLLSKTPLTDLMLLPQVASVVSNSYSAPTSIKKNISVGVKMTLKIILRKSTRKLLYAEAKEDFVDHLLSILTIPLGALAELLTLAPLRCIHNLYKSVEKLSVDRDLKSQNMKDKLLSPKLSAQCQYKIELLGMTEFFYPEGECWFQNLATKQISDLNLNKTKVSLKNSIGLKGFVQGPATFIITDDLTITPLSPIANIFLLDKLNVPISDLEEQVVNFGVEEAFKLSAAALTTTSALSHTFSMNLKQPKVEK